MPSGTRLIDQYRWVVALHGIVPSSSSPKWVCLKGYNHLTALITFKNSTTVTGSAIGLAQATAVAGTGTKVLGFTKMWACVDDAATNTVVETAVVANTFTTDATNSKTGFYIIEVDANTLDIANKFTSVQVTTGNGTAATIEVSYMLGGWPRFSGAPESFMNPLAD